MIHKARRYNVADETSLDDLVAKLTRNSWCLCNGFRIGGLLILNDAFSEDGAQEFAVIRESDGAQLESLTVSWMEPPALHAALAALLAGQAPPAGVSPEGEVHVATSMTSLRAALGTPSTEIAQLALGTVRVRLDHPKGCELCA